jgi:hypothetical protein
MRLYRCIRDRFQPNLPTIISGHHVAGYFIMHIPSAFKYITTLLLTVTVTIDANAGPISMKAAVAAYQRSSTKELSDLKTALKPPVDNLLAQLDTFSITISESGFDSGLLEN